MARIVKGIACAAIAALFVLLSALPFPREAGRAESFFCEWENGEVTEETYASASALLAGISDEGILLKREDLLGTVRDEEAVRVCGILQGGSLFDLLTLDMGATSDLGRLALFREEGQTLYLADGERYRFTGSAVERTEEVFCKKADLLSGRPGSGFLAESGAAELVVGGSAEIAASDLVGSAVVSVRGRAPYASENGALLLDTPSGRRLVLAVGGGTLVLPDSDYADEGALSACAGLVELDLPYVGASKRGKDPGMFARLFVWEGEYRVPETLRAVRVRGGSLGEFAFYACPHLESVDACGLNAEDVSERAFSDMVGWKTLHVPRLVEVSGDYELSRLPCGCYRYDRTGGSL